MTRGRTKSGYGVLLCAAALAVAAPAAQLDASPETAESVSRELAEVQVVGRKLWQLRRDMVEAEDRFYLLYNELNTNDDFDVQCSIEARTGTRIKARVCRAVFFARAQEEEARAFLDRALVMDEQGTIRTAGASASMPPQLIAMAREDEYRRTMLAVINSNPQLRRLVDEREALGARYDRVRREGAKGRKILFQP